MYISQKLSSDQIIIVSDGRVNKDYISTNLSINHDNKIHTIGVGPSKNNFDVGIYDVKINSDIDSTLISERADDLFADPIIEFSTTNQTFLQSNNIFDTIPDVVISVGFKPGVTDNPGKAALDGFRTIFPNASQDSDISTYITYAFFGLNGQATPEFIASKLFNNLIERAVISDNEMCNNGDWPMIEYPEKPPQEFKQPAHINLEISDDNFCSISTLSNRSRSISNPNKSFSVSLSGVGI